MKTFITLISFILTYVAVTRFLGNTLLNFVGFPGSSLSYKSESKKELKYILGVIISAIGHVYIYLSFIIYEINWARTRVEERSFSKYIIWFFCMITCLGSIQQIYLNAKKQSIEFPSKYLNPQIQALQITEIISFFSFFLFVFYPNSINPIWTWVLNIGFLF